MKKLALHWKIIIGMVLGIAFGFVVDSLSFKNTMGKLTLTTSDKVEAMVVDFVVKNKTEQRLDTLKASFYVGTDKALYSYNTFELQPNQTTTIDLIKEGDSDIYTFKSFVGDVPKMIVPVKNTTFVQDWVKPFGTIFIRFLKMIAVPLIVVSLIKGVSDLQDISKLSSMGGRTLGFYIGTTIIAVSIGLLAVNIVQPGSFISEATRAEFMAEFSNVAGEKIAAAGKVKDSGPLQPLIDLVPDNIFYAMQNNGAMLQTIVFVIFFGIGLILIEPKKAAPVKDFFDGANEVVLKMIDLIMLTAPYGVFALMAALIVESPNAEIFLALGIYALTVIGGLGLLILTDLLLVFIFTRRSPSSFIKAISPAQLLAFSTSSSAATLPVTMERVEEHIGVEKEVASFVLPVGATVNMDGTSLYQAVAAVFIAQVFGDDLSFAQQLSIIATATLASIGSAAVPGAGVLMLVVVLESIGVDPAGIALIFAVDRPLDMCRTVANVTGDAMVATVVGKSLGKLNDPQVKNWDDHYHKGDENEGSEEQVVEK